MKTNFFLVDDDQDDQEIFLMALHEIDDQLVCSIANHGLEALQKLAAVDTPPHFIFIDINMHKMNGMDCLKEIKKLDHLKDSQVIMFSTTTDPFIINKCHELGANDFMVKPPVYTQLVEALRNFIKMNTAYA